MLDTAKVTVVSPCTKRCELDAATGSCTGCRRTIEEILAWPDIDDDERRGILEAVEQRRG